MGLVYIVLVSSACITNKAAHTCAIQVSASSFRSTRKIIVALINLLDTGKNEEGREKEALSDMGKLVYMRHAGNG